MVKNARKSDRVKRLNKKFGTKRIYLKKSTIRNAGIGVFAAETIPSGVRLGEYKGRRLSEERAYSLPRSKQCYLFEVERRKAPNVLIDAYPLKTSIWTRFVNAFKTKKQSKKENVRYYQYAQKIWLKTTKQIKKGEELICDYGYDYWTDDEEEYWSISPSASSLSISNCLRFLASRSSNC